MDSRFSKLFTKGASTTEDLVKQARQLEPDVTAEEELTEANNLRNKLADLVNPVLPESLNIPKMTQADEVRNLASIPGQIGQTVGSLKVTPSARFGNIIQKISPEAKSLGNVVAKPSMQELSEQASKIGQKKVLDSAGTMEQLQARYGQELAKRKEMMTKGQLSPDAYNTFKQEMINKIRRGE